MSLASKVLLDVADGLDDGLSGGPIHPLGRGGIFIFDATDVGLNGSLTLSIQAWDPDLAVWYDWLVDSAAIAAAGVRRLLTYPLASAPSLATDLDVVELVPLPPGYRVKVAHPKETGKVIISASRTNPIVIGSTAHGFLNGETVYLSQIVGTVELNGRYFVVANKGDNDYELSGENALDATTAITGASQTNPVVIDSVAHGYSNGDEVWIKDVGGMVEINDAFFTVANKGDDDYELAGEDGTGHTEYTSGGTAQKALVSEYTSDGIAERTSLVSYTVAVQEMP